MNNNETNGQVIPNMLNVLELTIEIFQSHEKGLICEISYMSSILKITLDISQLLFSSNFQNNESTEQISKNIKNGYEKTQLIINKMKKIKSFRDAPEIGVIFDLINLVMDELEVFSNLPTMAATKNIQQIKSEDKSMDDNNNFKQQQQMSYNEKSEEKEKKVALIILDVLKFTIKILQKLNDLKLNNDIDISLISNLLNITVEISQLLFNSNFQNKSTEILTDIENTYKKTQLIIEKMKTFQTLNNSFNVSKFIFLIFNLINLVIYEL